MREDESERADPATLPPEIVTTVVAAAAGLGNLRRLQRGSGDPTLRASGADWWRASTTPGGDVLVQLSSCGDDVAARLWGPGSAWAAEQLPRLLGCHDQPEQWVDHFRDDPLLGPLLRRPMLPIGATDLIDYELAASIIEQKVTGAEAFHSLRTVLFSAGRPAPGPASLPGHPAHGMVCPPTADQWRQIPSWSYLQAGIDERRSRSLVGALARITALQRICDGPGSVTEVGQRLEQGLRSLPGIGPWTAAKVRQAALGDPDAWTVDDYHVPAMIARALAGGSASPQQAAELIDRFRPGRYRAELVILGAGLGRSERRGPRRSLPTHLPHDFGRSARSPRHRHH